MKKIAVCLAVLFSFFSLFANDGYVQGSANPKPVNFHGRRMMHRDADFFVRHIGSGLASESDKQGIEVIFIFSVPFDLRSIHKEEIFINEKQCPENVLIRFSKSGDALKFFIPNGELDLQDDGDESMEDSEPEIKTDVNQISISLGRIKSYNGTPIINSTFEKIEIGKNMRFGKMMQKGDLSPPPLPPPPPLQSESEHKNRKHHKGEFDE